MTPLPIRFIFVYGFGGTSMWFESFRDSYFLTSFFPQQNSNNILFPPPPLIQTMMGQNLLFFFQRNISVTLTSFDRWKYNKNSTIFLAGSLMANRVTVVKLAATRYIMPNDAFELVCSVLCLEPNKLSLYSFYFHL